MIRVEEEPVRHQAKGRPRESNGLETAQRIQNTATRLFYEKGYDVTTIRDIAESCGLTPGAIYNHFRSKDDILYSIVTWGHDELDRELAAAQAAAPAEPEEQLKAVAYVFALRHTKYREAAGVTNREYGSLSPKRRAVVVQRRRTTRAFVERLLLEASNAKKSATTRKRAENEITAMAVINMMIMVAEWYRDGGPLTAEEVARLHADLALRLLDR